MRFWFVVALTGFATPACVLSKTGAVDHPKTASSASNAAPFAPSAPAAATPVSSSGSPAASALPVAEPVPTAPAPSPSSPTPPVGPSLGFDRARVPRVSGAGETQGSEGCTTAAPVGEELPFDTTITDEHGDAGLLRNAFISVPTDYANDKAYPLVFAFHGCMSWNRPRPGYLLTSAQVGSGAIIVYPKAIGNDDCWYDGFAGTDGDLDAQLFLQMRAKARSLYCIDMNRTFVTGHSQGALLSNNLACRFGTADVTAIATHAGSLNADQKDFHWLSEAAYKYDGPLYPNGPNPFQVRSASEPSPPCGNNCDTQYSDGAYFASAKEFMCPIDGDPNTGITPKPKLPPPALLFHGDSDLTWHVRVQRGREAARHWAYVAECDRDPVTMAQQANHDTQYDNSDPCGRPTCAPGHEIEYCEINNHGHDVWNEALARTWDFFSRY